MVTTVQRHHVDLAGFLAAEEVRQAQPSSPALPREREAHPLGAGALPVRMEHDQVVALRVAGEVAVHRRGLHEAFRADAVEPHPQPRPTLRLHQLLVARPVAAGRLQPPLPHEGGPLVEVGQRCRPGGTPFTTRVPQNGGTGTGLSAATSERTVSTGRSTRSPLPPVTRDPALAALGQHRVGVAALDRHHGVHQPQALEGVAGVADLAVEHLGEVLLDEGPGQRGATEQHRPPVGDLAPVHLREVLLHDHGALHEQAGHPDHIGVGAPRRRPGSR